MPESTQTVIDIAQQMARAVARLTFTTPSHTYNPLRYAWPAHWAYIQRFGGAHGRVLLVGMNPGPWGMAQTGVPFGDVVLVREWLGIEAALQLPLPAQHAKYPILGFACHRREGSGRRLWGWARERFGTAERFFKQFFVWNYCPLLFLKDGRNLTPGKLRRAEAELLEKTCDTALCTLIDTLKPATVVGVGRYAQRRAGVALDDPQAAGYLPHPSPASPTANRDWPVLADAALAPWSNFAHR